MLAYCTCVRADDACIRTCRRWERRIERWRCRRWRWCRRTLWFDRRSRCRCLRRQRRTTCFAPSCTRTRSPSERRIQTATWSRPPKSRALYAVVQQSVERSTEFTHNLQRFLRPNFGLLEFNWHRKFELTWSLVKEKLTPRILSKTRLCKVRNVKMPELLTNTW